jgi:hypothetical protein
MNRTSGGCPEKNNPPQGTTPSRLLWWASLVSLRALVFSLVVAIAFPVQAQDGGAPVPVASAIITPADAPLSTLTVGPGVYLPERLAIARANELEALRARPDGPAAPVASTPVAVLMAFGLGLVVGGEVVGWVAVRLASP